MMLEVIHTRSKIVSETFGYFLNSGDKIVDIYTYSDEYMKNFSVEEAYDYAKDQIGVKYDTFTLLVQAVYIITGFFAKIVGSKGIWLGATGKKAEKKHVCSEFASNVINRGMGYNFRSKPYLDTTNDLTDDPRANKIKRIRNKEFLSVKELLPHGSFFFFAEHSLFTWRNLPSCILSWIIRRFTSSWGNHSGVIFVR